MALGWLASAEQAGRLVAALERAGTLLLLAAVERSLP